MARRQRTALRTVDALAGVSDGAEVYEDPASGVVWHFMLNYTDVTFGVYGNNKFYMAQLLQDGSNYYVFRKWGRVGAKTPMRQLEPYKGSLAKAQASFQKKFLDKSGNEWPLPANEGFEKLPGKYILVELDDEELVEDDDGGSDAEKDGVSDAPSAPSKLHERIQDVLKLICDADLIEKELAAMKLDLKQFPLGRLSKSQISQGYALLEQLSSAVTEIAALSKEGVEETSAPDEPTTTRRRSSRPRRAAASGRPKRIRILNEQLKKLSNEFYSLIPHDVGRSLPPVIRSMEEIKQKIDLLEVLADVEISQKLQKEQRRAVKQNGVHPLDAQYELLNVNMEPMAETDGEYQILRRYVETTHAPTHIQYKLQIRSILKVHRSEEDEYKETFTAIKNRRLLWHGSRLCNVVGILSKGLRVAPPEAPTNGYMFGKGIYFADSVSKSANYCWATPEQPRGVLLLAEVALGDTFPALEAEDLDYKTIREARGCDSLHGLGRMAAPVDTHETLADGVVVPVGEFEPTGVENGELLYNEFVVYRREQVRLRYLVALDFVYDDL